MDQPLYMAFFQSTFTALESVARDGMLEDEFKSRLATSTRIVHSFENNMLHNT